MEKKEAQPPSWQSKERASSWARQHEWRENILGEATRLMLAAAQLRPGDHVLDIAAGTGDQSLLAAQEVGPTGTVLATDISAEMLKEAAHLAEQEGCINMTTRVMNAEQLDLADQTFDAVICRLGLMLIQKQHQALLEIRRVLKLGRKLAALVWSTPDSRPFLSIFRDLLAKYTNVPSQGLRPSSLAEPAAFEQALKDAGFREMSIQAVSIQFRFASMEALFQQIPHHSLASAMEQLKPPDRQRLQEEYEHALRRFEGPQGLVFPPSELLLGIGTR